MALAGQLNKEVKGGEGDAGEVVDRG